MKDASNTYMQAALQEAYAGIAAHEGGPFGSVVVKDGVIVGRGHNQVLALHDPTCHGEMQAIRDACKQLATHDLSECELYTTAEPCPMCLGAIMWANITTVYYGCNRVDSAEIGFRDDAFYQYIEGQGAEIRRAENQQTKDHSGASSCAEHQDIETKTNAVNLIEIDREACLTLFKDYQSSTAERY